MYQIQVTEDTLRAIQLLVEALNLPYDSNTLDELAYDAARVRGWLTHDKESPSRAEQAAGLKALIAPIDTSLNEISLLSKSDRDHIYVAFERQKQNLQTIADSLIRLPFLLDELAETFKQGQSEALHSISQRFLTIASTLIALDDYTQSKLLDALFEEQWSPPAGTPEPLSRLRLLLSTATRAHTLLAKPGRQRQNELHIAVAFLLDRYQTLTGKKPTYQIDDNQTLVSDAGRFVQGMIDAPGRIKQPNAVANAVKAYCSKRNASR